MVLNQYARSMNWVDVIFLETVNDDNTCVVLIFCHHILCHRISARDAIVEVISMSCTNIRDAQASLCPSGSISRVSMNYATQLWECAVENQVGWCIR